MNFLFDLDDTLYPERQYILQGFLAVAQYLSNENGLDLIETYLEIVSIFKSGSEKVFDDLLSRKGIIKSPADLINVYRSSERRLFLYSDVPDTMKSLKTLGNKLALLTNGNCEVQRRKIKILELEKFFDDIFVLDEFGKEFWKPSTLIFDIIYNNWNGSLRDYIFVGNAQEDLEFTKRLGIKFIFVDRANNIRRAQIINEQGVYIVKSLYEVLDLIAKLGR